MRMKLRPAYCCQCLGCTCIKRYVEEEGEKERYGKMQEESEMPLLSPVYRYVFCTLEVGVN